MRKRAGGIPESPGHRSPFHWGMFASNKGSSPPGRSIPGPTGGPQKGAVCLLQGVPETWSEGSARPSRTQDELHSRLTDDRPAIGQERAKTHLACCVGLCQLTEISGKLTACLAPSFMIAKLPVCSTPFFFFFSFKNSFIIF